MIRSKAFDVECIPNLFSVAIVDLNDYLSKFSDCVDKKGKLKKKFANKKVRQWLKDNPSIIIQKCDFKKR